MKGNIGLQSAGNYLVLGGLADEGVDQVVGRLHGRQQGVLERDVLHHMLGDPLQLEVTFGGIAMDHDKETAACRLFRADSEVPTPCEEDMGGVRYAKGKTFK